MPGDFGIGVRGHVIDAEQWWKRKDTEVAEGIDEEVKTEKEHCSLQQGRILRVNPHRGESPEFLSPLFSGPFTYPAWDFEQ